jgi:hypothetical protein
VARFRRLLAVLRLSLLSALCWGVVLGVLHLTQTILRMGGIWSLEGAWGVLSNEFVRGFLRGMLGGAVAATVLALIPPATLDRFTFRRSGLLGAAAGTVVYLLGRLFIIVVVTPIPLVESGILSFALFGAVTGAATLAVVRRGEVGSGERAALEGGDDSPRIWTRG